jgi:hypothetical protein
MTDKRRIAAQRPDRVLLVLLALALLTAGCASRGLPSKAERALRESVSEWAGVEVAFEISSAQKAGSGAGEVTIPIGVNPDTSQLGACPPAGTSETWCVVISPPVMDQEGQRVSRFLVQSQGRYWDAHKLLDADAAVFEVQGCTNWDAP